MGYLFNGYIVGMENIFLIDSVRKSYVYLKLNGQSHTKIVTSYGNLYDDRAYYYNISPKLSHIAIIMASIVQPEQFQFFRQLKTI